MRVFAIPTITAGVTAGLSVLFFVGLSRVYTDAMLGQIILTQAAVALVQIALIPSSWVYLLGAGGTPQLVRRYSEGQAVEWVGITIGALVVWVGSTVFGDRASGSIFLFVSLSIAASSSCLGYLLATTSWRRYVLWVLTPNLIRLPLILATPALVGAGFLPDLADNRAGVIFTYFLVPELFRFVGIYVPLAITTFRWPGIAGTIGGARLILRNWLFDVGSATTDQADKLVVGTILGSHVLVAYFFARKMAVITVMVTEPVYWESYRRQTAELRYGGLVATWLKGFMLAVLLWSMTATIIVLTIKVPLVAEYLPTSIVTMLGMFLTVTLLDSLFAANRWSRYLAQATDRSVQLLIVRLGVFGVFSAVLALLAPSFPVWGVAFAMLAGVTCEVVYVARLAWKATLA